MRTAIVPPRIVVAAALSLAALAPSGVAQAAGEAAPLLSNNWSHEGLFGTFDRAAAQRGFQVYREVCAGCHGIEYIAFPQRKRHLSEARLILDADSYAELSHHQPLEIASLEPTTLRAYFDSKGALKIVSEAEWEHFDREADDEEIILLLMAMRMFDDNA